MVAGDDPVLDQLIQQPQRTPHHHTILGGPPAQLRVTGQQRQALGLGHEIAGHVGQGAVVVLQGQLEQRRDGFSFQRLDDQAEGLQLLRLALGQLVQDEVCAGERKGQCKQLLQQTTVTEVAPDVGVADVDALHGEGRMGAASGGYGLRHQGLGQLRVLGAGGGDAGFEFIAEGKEFVDLRDDTVLSC